MSRDKPQPDAPAPLGELADARAAPAMSVVPALRTLAAVRGEKHIVITNQGSARLWPKLSDHPLDFNYNPSTMGGAIPFGLGLALARAAHEVIVISGDGSLLMSLGSLVSVIDSGATNLTIVLLDNGRYEVTGGQRTPGSQSPTDFAGLARAAGFPNVAHFWDRADWEQRARSVLRERGPRFVWLVVQSEPGDYLSEAGTPIDEQLNRLSATLDASQDVSS